LIAWLLGLSNEALMKKTVKCPGEELPSGQSTSSMGQPSRIGKKSVAGHFPPEVVKTLKILSAQNDETVQVVLARALNDYFETNGLARIADETPLPRGGAAARKPPV
jgi:hypothetical protein